MNFSNKLVAWTSNDSDSLPHAFGQKEANELGVFDMSGNVWEWCHDWYDEKYYAKNPGKNPKRSATGPHHVIRGGNWSREPAASKVAYRSGDKIGYRYIGFRLASSISLPKTLLKIERSWNNDNMLHGHVRFYVIQLSKTHHQKPENGFD